MRPCMKRPHLYPAQLFALLALSCSGPEVTREVHDREGRVRASVAWSGDHKEGPVKLFDAEGSTILHGHYTRDLRDGTWWGTARDGRPLRLEQYAEGRKHGLQCYWWPQGGLKRAERYAHGEPEGTLIRLRADGRPEQLSEHHHGLQHGRHVRWWYTGDSLASILMGGFHHGESTGRWTEIGADGRLIYAADFERGSLVRMIKPR